VAEAKVIADVEITCPECEAKLGVEVTREKVEDPQYSFGTKVRVDKQGKLELKGDAAKKKSKKKGGKK